VPFRFQVSSAAAGCASTQTAIEAVKSRRPERDKRADRAAAKTALCKMANPTAQPSQQCFQARVPQLAGRALILLG
jgi:hypothetical protein